MKNKVSVVIPAYNEETGIVKVLGGLVDLFKKLGSDYEIVVVDDGSKDKTREKVSEFKRGNVVLLQHEHNLGYGAALKTGIRRAKNENIVVIDADCTYPVDEIPSLLADLIVKRTK